MRTTICAALLAIAFTPDLTAQPGQADLIAERAKKLAKPVFQKADWIFDYDQARAEAKKQQKLLFTYFTRSFAY